MQFAITINQGDNDRTWDDYVQNHPDSNLYHLSAWRQIIQSSYGHSSYYLLAFRCDNEGLDNSSSINVTLDPLPNPATDSNTTKKTGPIAGILPLVHLNHFLFGNNLFSIPFVDLGGILADDVEAEKALLSEAIKIGRNLKVDRIELRHTSPLAGYTTNSVADSIIKNSSSESRPAANISIRTHKVRMILELPEDSDTLMKSFKSKLRSQIRKPIKEGLSAKVGGLELLEDFYHVFSINMRDLGSPVHSKKLIKNTFNAFSRLSKIIIIYKDSLPLACSLVIGFKDILENPWASALREYSRLNSNMLLYWTMLEYACDNGYKYFDFGRSSPGQGTYKFKEQWGAKPTPLCWYIIHLSDQPKSEDNDEKSKFNKAIQCWRKLPVPVTRILGPIIRKHIGL